MRSKQLVHTRAFLISVTMQTTAPLHT
jgi:hypothetical protein